jgi:hypothetical protein
MLRNDVHDTSYTDFNKNFALPMLCPRPSDVESHQQIYTQYVIKMNDISGIKYAKTLHNIN